MECDLVVSVEYTELFDFNSRTHVECDWRVGKNAMKDWNFNSRTHVECDSDASVVGYSGSLDFNSRTHVECDTSPRKPLKGFLNFNSRTHVECDSQLPDCAVRHRSISTHALTWSATTPDMLFPKLLLFQLTHSRGVRRPGNVRNIYGSSFQLTHSRGVRPNVRFCDILLL